MLLLCRIHVGMNGYTLNNASLCLSPLHLATRLLSGMNVHGISIKIPKHTQQLNHIINSIHVCIFVPALCAPNSNGDLNKASSTVTMKCGPVKSTATIHHNRAQDGSSGHDIYPWPLLILSVYLSVERR